MVEPRSGDSNPVEELLVKVEPDAELTFVREDLDTGRPAATFSITNASSNHVAFKVKTNNIEGYKVKPFFGIIPLSNTVHVTVVQNPGCEFHTTDKLLILTTDIATLHMSPQELINHWRGVPKDSVKEHRLRCVAADAIEAKDVASRAELTSRSVASLSALPTAPRGIVKRKSRLSYSPAIQSRPKGTPQLESIQAALEELREQLDAASIEAQNMSKTVDQVRIFLIACIFLLSLCLVVLFMVKTCLTSQEWFC